MNRAAEFKDLVFAPHKFAKNAETLPRPLSEQYRNAKQAIMYFKNGYGISVIFGKCFYSNGVNTYEVAVLIEGHGLTYETPITDDVLGNLTESEVSQVMAQIQKLNPIEG